MSDTDLPVVRFTFLKIDGTWFVRHERHSVQCEIDLEHDGVAYHLLMCNGTSAIYHEVRP